MWNASTGSALFQVVIPLWVGQLMLTAFWRRETSSSLGGGLRLEVFHTPGHSKGSISLLLHEDRALFYGDAVPLVGDATTYDDVLACVKSIKKLKKIKGINLLLSSWDNPQEGERV